MHKCNKIILIIFSFIVLLTLQTTAYTQGEDVTWKTYKNKKLKVQVKYPLPMKIQVLQDAVDFFGDKNSLLAGYRFSLLNVAYNSSQSFENKSARRLYYLARKAKVGSTITLKSEDCGVYRKIENILVAGYPAVKVVFERNFSHKSASPNACVSRCAGLDFIIVIIKKGKAMWEITKTLYYTQREQGELAKFFDRFLAGLKFL